jgi:hypothetical protein
VQIFPLFAVVPVGVFCVDTLSNIRALVNGESLWNKREEIAITHLLRYVDSRQLRGCGRGYAGVEVNAGVLQARS